VWDRLGRSLHPNQGARANAAASLDDLRRTRQARAEALEAFGAIAKAQGGPPPGR
jgi:hypothetical protein